MRPFEKNITDAGRTRAPSPARYIEPIATM
jgi:hypothetical protein